VRAKNRQQIASRAAFERNIGSAHSSVELAQSRKRTRTASFRTPRSFSLTAAQFRAATAKE
jgi:hypothetical protein